MEKRRGASRKSKFFGIEGELSQNTWVDSAGNNHSKVQIIVNEINLLSSPKGKDDSAKPPPSKGNAPEDDIPF
jgi:single-stranded DNA-binding protein